MHPRSIVRNLWFVGLVGLLLAGGVKAASAGQNTTRFPYGFGLNAANPGDYDRYGSVRLANRDAEELPERFTLEEYLPPIANQGRTGAECWPSGGEDRLYQLLRPRRRRRQISQHAPISATRLCSPRCHQHA